MSKTNNKTEGFNDSYLKLAEIADKLRTQQEHDIDSLVPMVAEATKAYEICKDRLSKVKKALAEYNVQTTDNTPASSAE